MHRSSSNTRVADDFYRNSSSFFSSPSSIDGDNNNNNHNTINGNGNGNGNVNNGGNLPVYSPGSHPAKKEKSRLRSAENAVHLIPLVLLLSAIVLWFFSNPVDVVNRKPGAVGAAIEGLHAAGNGIDGTQNSMLAHLELEDHDLVHHHQIQHHQSADKKRLT